MSLPIGRTGLARVTCAAAPSLAFVSSAKEVALFEDFLGDVLNANWNYVEGTDASPTDAAVLAGGVGGILRMAAGDAGTGLAADLGQLNSFLNWRASNGDLTFEAKLSLSSIAVTYLFVGFTDVISLEPPIESAASADTLTSNATNAVGIMFDTRMTTDNFWLVGVKNDVDATAQNSAVTPVAATDYVLRVTLSKLGHATFFINGVRVGTEMLNAVTASVALTPTIAYGNISGTTPKTMDVDYVAVSMSR